MTKGWNNDEACYFVRRKKERKGEKKRKKYRLVVFRPLQICIASIWKNGFHIGFTISVKKKPRNRRNESRLPLPPLRSNLFPLHFEKEILFDSLNNRKARCQRTKDLKIHNCLSSRFLGCTFQCSNVKSLGKHFSQRRRSTFFLPSRLINPSRPSYLRLKLKE